MAVAAALPAVEAATLPVVETAAPPADAAAPTPAAAAATPPVAIAATPPVAIAVIIGAPKPVEVRVAGSLKKSKTTLCILKRENNV